MPDRKIVTGRPGTPVVSSKRVVHPVPSEKLRLQSLRTLGEGQNGQLVERLQSALDLARDPPGEGERQQPERQHDHIIEQRAAALPRQVLQDHAGGQESGQPDESGEALPIIGLEPARHDLPDPFLVPVSHHGSAAHSFDRMCAG